jgi:hypothetical protein
MPIINFCNEEIEEENMINSCDNNLCSNILVVVGIIPYSYHDILNYGFCSHHSYPNSGYYLGLTLLSSSFGDR